MISKALYLAGLAAAVLFAALPVLLHGYTFPPGDDPGVLAGRLVHWWQAPYYGHLPAAVMGITLYYYLTPVIAYLGIWAWLGKYGPAAVLLAWGSLWLVSRAPLFDLHNGTWIGLVNFYGLGLVFLRLLERGLRHRASIWWPLLLGAALVPFHAFTGLVIASGVGLYSLVSWRKTTIAIMAVMAMGVIVSWQVWGSSIGKIEAALAQSGSMALGDGIIDYPRLAVDRFVLEYLGFGTLVFWFLAFNIVLNAWQRGWRPRMDASVAILGIIAVPLIAMTFTPLAINADRTVKILIGVVTLLAALGVVRGLRYLDNWKLTAGCSAIVGGCFALASPQLISYWLLSGSYR